MSNILILTQTNPSPIPYPNFVGSAHNSPQNYAGEWSDMVNLRTQISSLTEQLDREQRLRRSQGNSNPNP